MIRFLAGFVGKASGPMLVYILIGLIATNAASGYLLKRAWTKNAQAVLQCQNDALRDSNAAKDLVARELVIARDELAAEREAKRTAGIEAEKQIAVMMRAKEIEHAEALANMETAENEIPDDDFFCASESASAAVVGGMRDAARNYNEARNRPD